MATYRNPSFQRMVDLTLKKTAAALRDADVPFCLIGSISAWVRGGPESSHDLDFGIREEDILRASEALEKIGMRIEIPPEDWLIKAHDESPELEEGEAAPTVDLIYAPSGVRITDEVIARADQMDVLAHRMPVLNASDLMIMKLLSLREQNLNMTSSIATARSIREQIDWGYVRQACRYSPYAEGFFVIAEELGICPAIEASGPAGPAVDVLAQMQQHALQPVAGEMRRALQAHLDSQEA